MSDLKKEHVAEHHDSIGDDEVCLTSFWPQEN